MVSEISADLIVSGGHEFKPAEVLEKFGLAADAIWHIGDRIGRSCRRRKCNAWVISTGSLKGHSLSGCLAMLFKKVESRWRDLRAVCSREGMETQVSIAVYVYDEAPEMLCSREDVRRMAELKAEMDIDVVMLGA